MSGVDVIRAMRVAEAYCYDAGAANAARAMKEARAAVAELLEADAEYDKAERAMDRECGYTPEHILAIRTFHAATERRRGALARCRGGAA